MIKSREKLTHRDGDIKTCFSSDGLVRAELLNGRSAGGALISPITCRKTFLKAPTRKLFS